MSSELGVNALMGHLEGLAEHERSLVVGIKELVRLADSDGRIERLEWMQGVASDLEGEGPAGESRSPSDLQQYLEERVVRRIEEAGFAERIPAPERWSALEWRGEVWEKVRDRRSEIVNRLEATLEEMENEARSGSMPEEESVGPHGSLLQGENLTKVYQGRPVVNEVDIHVQQGEIVGLLGPNGAGKTTTFYMIVGLIPPDQGIVRLDDRDITKVPMYRRARMGVGYLAQEPSVFRKLTVEENVLAILETMKLPKRRREERLEELLQELSIEHLRKSKAYSLSGGERRRLEITRALVQNPKFMLLDEPFAGIDPIAVSDIQQIVASLKDRRIGVIISDHNVEQTLDIVDRAYIMYEGRIRVAGSVSELVWNDDVAQIYLGPTLTSRMRQRYPEPASVG